MGSVHISDVSMPAWAILGRLLRVTAVRRFKGPVVDC
jgi:hypothetical protein